MVEHEHDPRQTDEDQPDSSQNRDDSEGQPPPTNKRSVISTTDRVVTEGPGQQAEWRQHPDATLVTETSRVDRPIPAYLIPAPGGEAYESHGTGRKQGAEKRRDMDRSDKGDRSSSSGPEERVKRETDPHHESPQPSPWRNLLISAAVALAAGMIGAGAVVYFFDSSKSESKESSSDGQSSSQKKAGSEGKSKSKGSGKEAEKGSGADETAQSGSSIPGFTRADDADALRRQIEHLSERIDQLGHRLDTQSHPREEVPPDLRTLQIKVGDLTRTSEEVGNLPSRFRRLESRFEDLQQEMKSLRDRLSTSREDGVTRGSERKTALATVAVRRDLTVSPPMTVEAMPDEAWGQGVALFKTGHYPEASNVFRGLQITRPDDARVWYYSALAVGLTTGDWTRSARELIERGIQRERAGTPEKDKIDVAFTGLSDAQGRKWLNAYREKVGIR